MAEPELWALHHDGGLVAHLEVTELDQPCVTAYDAIRSTVVLTRPDGTTVPEFLMHLDEVRREARWRWSDVVFDS